MAWSDRRYDEESGFIPRQPQDGLFLVLGITVGLHLLKVLLVGMHFVEEGTVERHLGVSVAGLQAGHFWQVFTYQVVHADIWHLLWNCVMLFFAGRLLEGLVGARRFLWMYSLCGVGGSIGAFFERGGYAPVVGASGSIMGVLVILMVMVPNLEVRVLIIDVRMKWLVLILVLIDIAYAFGDGRGVEDGKAHWTHLFGGMSGFCLAWVWPRVLQPRLTRYRSRQRRRESVRQLESALGTERELDRILAKISQTGMPSLSSAERRFLEDRSRKSQASRRE
ncbi:MAG: rhomboid family intramembrane serine protease [Planctomycetes bacterium]|nr:rhomboid family intramembrane serine protease [Planctomycetota bacterium]